MEQPEPLSPFTGSAPWPGEARAPGQQALVCWPDGQGQELQLWLPVPRGCLCTLAPVKGESSFHVEVPWSLVWESKGEPIPLRGLPL